MPVISIIVPVYKVEKYLPMCITSILEQTFTDFELILVDDGSPDKCPVICDQFAQTDCRIKVVHKENGGLSDARNAGLKVAKGKYIGFVDSDDFIRRDMYEILLRELESRNVDFIKSDFRTFSEEDEVIDEIISEITEYSVNVYLPLDAIKDFFCTEYSNSKPMKSTVWDALYKRELFFDNDNLTVWFPKGKMNEDTYIFTEIVFRANKIAHINVPFYFYRIREDSIIHSSINLSEINSCDLWKHIDTVVSKYTNEYVDVCAFNSITRYLNILKRTFYSKYRTKYFNIIRVTILNDKNFYLMHINDTRLKRTMSLIKNYPLYLCVKKLVGNKVY